MKTVMMWWDALHTIPRVKNEQWLTLDVVSKWLISTRAAVLVMTLIASVIGALLAWRTGDFSWTLFLLTALGLMLAHATNNLINDFVDYHKGVDNENYYRAQYGPQPLVHGLMSVSEHVKYIAVTGILAFVVGMSLVYLRGGYTIALLAVGMFFVLFYTWPLKFFGLGEVAVAMVWGPLMVGGTYYEITGELGWGVLGASVPYLLGVTTVIFGKHIDKLDVDAAKGIRTLPVLLGETRSRTVVRYMMVAQYAVTVLLVVTRALPWTTLAVLLALPALRKVWPYFMAPKPVEKPADFPNVWPNYFVAAGFYHNRAFGIAYLASIAVGVLLGKLF
jgi:1,4-dihydroxy-2-naphthoate octaprenyltransferase